MENLFVLFNGLWYVLLGSFLFAANLYLFDVLSPFWLKKDVLDVQSKALWHLIRWQLIGQSLMIGMLIYFQGQTYDFSSFSWEIFLQDALGLVSFWLIGILVFQLILFVIGKYINLVKEIVLEENVSLGMSIEGFLIGISFILSLSLYSY